MSDTQTIPQTEVIQPQSTESQTLNPEQDRKIEAKESAQDRLDIGVLQTKVENIDTNVKGLMNKQDKMYDLLMDINKKP